ncbi:AraC family transcriptional regulator [Streptomyces sp. A7024]|uniref:AraC family transcriptional regulator n=1 Tax=Streptomyces coryli TaxID=1128680 RepID=A0A6G4TVX1_9ACTN|nr:AraC family transcriptional regulator [Streptomyces coryli]NGN63670.1 AraC family transcriptional regulator [Streptomyces coryli]
MGEPREHDNGQHNGGRTVTVHHVRAALRGVERRGLDTLPLLQYAAIAPLLLADDRARVTPEQFTRLIQALHVVMDDEFLGLGPARSKRGTFAMMCYAAIGCSDLRGALRRAARFYALFPGGPELTLEVRGDPSDPGDTSAPGAEAVLAIRNEAEFHDPFLSECLMVIWHRLSSWLIGRRIPLATADFGFPPPVYADEYPALFGCPVRFGAAHTEARFAAHWLAAPVVRKESELEVLLRRAPADLLSRREYGTTVSEQVRHALAAALRDGGRRRPRLPELREVAGRLAVSPATLRRRLEAEGTSFTELKDTVRRDAAITSLAQGQEPIAGLAARLGFAEDASFHRAFRRWTGTTPGAYRGGCETSGQQS